MNAHLVVPKIGWKDKSFQSGFKRQLNSKSEKIRFASTKAV